MTEANRTENPCICGDCGHVEANHKPGYGCLLMDCRCTQFAIAPLSSNLVHDLRAAGDNCPDYGGTLREAADEIDRLRLALGRAAFRWRYAATNWGLPQRAIDECLQYAEDCAQGAAESASDG